MDIFMIILLLMVLFILMKNIASHAEYVRLKKEAVVFHEDRRRWVKACRILSIVGAAAVAAMIMIFLVRSEIMLLEGGFFSWIAMMAAFAFFAVAPYTLQKWVITEKGVFIYNMGQMIPWGQVITTGIQKGKGKRMSRIVVQIKKEQGEMLKARYQMLGTDDPEEAERVSELIRQFVHALDRKKLYKKTTEERSTEIKKRRWF